MEKYYIDQIKEVGLRVKKRRNELGITQQSLAGLCDIDIRTIQRIEKGEFGFGLHILFALAQALKQEPSELVKDLKLPI